MCSSLDSLPHCTGQRADTARERPSTVQLMLEILAQAVGLRRKSSCQGCCCIVGIMPTKDLAQALLAAPAPFETGAPLARARPLAKGKAAPKVAAVPGKRRSRIDLDEDVDAARKIAKEAKKVLKSKIAQAKVAERKKVRIVAKAAKLPSDDLLRIALYKRINIVKTAMSADVEGSLHAVMNGMDISQLQQFVNAEIQKRMDLEAASSLARELEPAGGSSTAAASGVQQPHVQPQQDGAALVVAPGASDVEPAAGPSPELGDGQETPGSPQEAEVDAMQAP